jgi:hypothetical protein
MEKMLRVKSAEMEGAGGRHSSPVRAPAEKKERGAKK